jgi:hypothetical protein
MVTTPTTLLDEIYVARRHLATELIAPLAHEAERAGRDAQSGTAGERHWTEYELAKLRFKLALLDHTIDLFRLHDSAAIAGAIEQEAFRARREMGRLVTDAQVAAICRMRARTMTIERQVACVHATLLMIESDVLAETGFEVFPVDFELLDGKFGAWFGYWERNVGPAMAAFCRTHGRDEDRRLRAALADYVAHVSAAAWPRLAPAVQRPAVQRSAEVQPLRLARRPPAAA